MTNINLIPIRPGDLPRWAQSYLDEHLDKDIDVVNAHIVNHGPLKNAVLLNTSEGAALVSRHRFGEPSLVRLPLPGRRFSFTCVDCKERIELMDADTPRPFFCSRCARHYTLSREGDSYVLFTAMDGAAAKKKPRGPGWTRVDTTKPPATKPLPANNTKQAAPRKIAAKTRKRAPYRFKGYTLYTRQVELKNGRTQRIYYFSKKPRPGAKPIPKPDGYQTLETRTGLPVLRRSHDGATLNKKKAGSKKKTGAKKKSGPKKTRSEPRCSATTEEGKPCRNTSRKGSKFCAAHKNHRPRKAPKPTGPRQKKEKSYEAQCQALTHGDKQCRNSSRGRSKYCASHFGYRPPRRGDTIGWGKNTKPRVGKAENTRPSHRHRQQKRSTDRPVQTAA